MTTDQAESGGSRRVPKLCGAASTSICVLPPRHEGLCSYWADSERNKQLRADLERVTAELERVKGQIAGEHEIGTVEHARQHVGCGAVIAAKETELEQMRAEGDALRKVETAARHYGRNKHQCSARYEQRACTCGYGALRNALARFDATRKAAADAEEEK